jgi:hypothetical protein
MTGRISVTHEECAESFIVEKYILCELSAVERDDFEEHYFDCPECAEAVRRLSQLRAGTQAIMCGRVEEASSRWQQLQSWWSRRQPLGVQPALAGALAALCLTAVVGYQNLELRNQLRPQSVQSVFLAPATRGELPLVRSQATGPFVLLEADLPTASGKLTWSVRSGDGKVALDGAGPAPEPGLSFKVLLPADKLQAGEYALTVRSDSGNEWLFRFRNAMQ